MCYIKKLFSILFCVLLFFKYFITNSVNNDELCKYNINEKINCGYIHEIQPRPIISLEFDYSNN